MVSLLSLQHLHHVFLVVTPPGGAPCIADPTFRSSFQLSEMHTTAAYAAALPDCELSFALRKFLLFRLCMYISRMFCPLC